MAQANSKESPGFFSVLLGFGSVNLKGETQPDDAKRPFDETRSAPPNPRPSRGSKPVERPRASTSEDAQVSLRSSLSITRNRSVGKRDTSAYLPLHAGRKHSEPSIEGQRADGRPSISSVSSNHIERFHDAVVAAETKNKSKATVRAARKVMFNTPSHSLRNGKSGHSRPDQAVGSSDLFARAFEHEPKRRSTRAKNTSTISKTEFEERNRSSSTATLQKEGEPRPYIGSGKRSSTGDFHPLNKPSQANGFQAVCESDPDRVIIAPIGSTEAELKLDSRYLPVASTAQQRRIGPTPIATSFRATRDPSQTRERSTDRQRSRSHRDRQSFTRVDGESKLANEPSRLPKRQDKMTSRSARPARPMGPMPNIPTARLLSNNMSWARAGERDPIGSYNSPSSELPSGTTLHERQFKSQARTQRA